MTDTTKQTDRCNCETCRPNSILDPEGMRMILCSLCGNKRCPHATDHRNPCTNSNDVGQVGSSYEKAWDPRADLVKPIQAEPVAWIIQTEKFGVISDPYAVMGRYKDVLDCCDKGDPIPLYTHPAPALTAELKAELIECLKIGLAAQMYVHGSESKSPDFIKEVYFDRQDKIQAAITKLTNLGQS